MFREKFKEKFTCDKNLTDDDIKAIIKNHEQMLIAYPKIGEGKLGFVTQQKPLCSPFNFGTN